MTLEVPCAPSGVLRFADDVVELLSGGDTVRIPVLDITRFNFWEPKKGRCKVQFAYRAGIGGGSQIFWIQEADRDAAVALAEAAVAARNARRDGAANPGAGDA